MTNILFQNSLKRNTQKTPPIWFMRQAGRYHSHYRKLKEKYSFEDLCKTPDLAAEVAFGPIKEFDYDIAILFSDILFVLEGLGLELKFDPGPKFNSYINSDNINYYSNIDRGIEHMQFQYEAIKITKEKLPINKSLIGFVGGPWTLSKYAFGNNNSGSINIKMNLEFISRILLPLLKKNIQLQLDAGVEVVMVFDSSLHDLDEINFHEIYIKILQDIAISFPNKVGYYSRGKNLSDLNSILSFPFAGFGYDHTIDLISIFENQKQGFIQGNFNEQSLLCETDIFLNDLKDYIDKMKSIQNLNGWICGLGHGINKNTPEKNVHLFIENIRKEFS
ncbi:uroporphyrinogen decarboxylase [Pelagibacteraceae bacterium]|nr:uroporphyrinogen decarboxylase [Pelagibacteraceae bacterium]